MRPAPRMSGMTYTHYLALIRRSSGANPGSRGQGNSADDDDGGEAHPSAAATVTDSEERRSVRGREEEEMVINGRMKVAFPSDKANECTSPASAESCGRSDPLLLAIEAGDAEALRGLLRVERDLGRDLEPNLGSKDQGPEKASGWMSLHVASWRGETQCLRLLLKEFPGWVDRRTLNEETGLLLATRRGHVACMRLLLEEGGANPDICANNRETPLYSACERGDLAAASLLLQFGADPAQRCARGSTALHAASARGSVELLALLLQLQPQPRPGPGSRAPLLASGCCRGLTALHYAAQRGHADAVRCLIDAGSAVNAQASDGGTPLLEAVRGGHVAAARMLLIRGEADANIPAEVRAPARERGVGAAGKDAPQRVLPLHEAAGQGCVELLDLLLPATSRACVRRTPSSPLLPAALGGHAGALRRLLSAGYCPNGNGQAGGPGNGAGGNGGGATARSPLHAAVSARREDCVRLLLAGGADPDGDPRGDPEPPVVTAARLGDAGAVRLLLDGGADWGAGARAGGCGRGGGGGSCAFPAVVALARGHPAMLKMFLDAGCDAAACFRCRLEPGANPRSGEARPLQFCELFSGGGEGASEGASVVAALLDYVGSVRLCHHLRKSLSDRAEWASIGQATDNPRTLAHLCRVSVRASVGSPRLRQLRTLPLPRRLLDYILHAHP
ncbi:uncharacterized protein LOC116948400 [Petromyzon marinus]|uniref:Ankyrin repeat and SOCS box protein 2-like isoform X2 n=1 Tax=Petromyzon marinus TaxID=7757 RepID=A0AAJ7TP04_PETMA|nr:ankyrin repeat and SOCS box protein 2-like isoform X2 [Petromyzon marinus]